MLPNTFYKLTNLCRTSTRASKLTCVIMAFDESDQCLFLDSVFGFLSSGVLAQLVTIVALIYLFKELTMGICKCNKELHGKVVIVTGANSGLCQKMPLGNILPN